MTMMLCVLLAGCAAGAPAVTRSDAQATVSAVIDAPLAPTDAAMAAEPTTTPSSAPTVEETRIQEPTEPPTTDTPTPVPTPEPTELPAAVTVSEVVERGSSGRREVALTFDAGAERGDAELILDILAEFGIVGSFSITGEWADANPDLVQRIADEGHMLFNHTWSHSSWTGQSTANDPDDPTTWVPMPSAERQEELTRTEELIESITGEPLPRYFRPPYADYDQSVLDDAGAAGYAYTVMWSCQSLAWMGMTAEEIVVYCTTDMQPGDIILLHVTDAGTDSAALHGLIEGLRDQGFAFVTVEAILAP